MFFAVVRFTESQSQSFANSESDAIIATRKSRSTTKQIKVEWQYGVVAQKSSEIEFESVARTL